MKRTQLSALIEPNQMAALREEAVKQNRAVGQIVRMILTAWMENQFGRTSSVGRTDNITTSKE